MVTWLSVAIDKIQIEMGGCIRQNRFQLIKKTLSHLGFLNAALCVIPLDNRNPDDMVFFKQAVQAQLFRLYVRRAHGYFNVSMMV